MEEGRVLRSEDDGGVEVSTHVDDFAALVDASIIHVEHDRSVLGCVLASQIQQHIVEESTKELLVHAALDDLRSHHSILTDGGGETESLLVGTNLSLAVVLLEHSATSLPR